jgi:hypothetical protein
VVCLLFAAASVAPIGAAQTGGPVVHVVLVWLKEPGNRDHREQIIRVSRTFAHIDGVIEVRAGEPLASDRPVVDDSFDVGIYIRFASAEDMRAYLADQRHVRAVEEVLRPLTARYQVYDFIDPGALREVAN